MASLPRLILGASILLVGCDDDPADSGRLPSVAPSAAPTPPTDVSPNPAAWAGTIRHPGELVLGELVFVHVPEGAFVLGSPDDEPGRNDDETQRFVAIYDAFHLLTTEVTQDQFARRMGSATAQGDFPVTDVTWDDAIRFCDRLHEEFPDYRFRLPTEEEWEYACRAGSTEPFSIAPSRRPDFLIALKKFASGDERFLERFLRHELCFDCGGPMPVRSLPPNEWGLHEMHGNVWEWCGDNDLANPDFRPIRGGAWSSTSMWGCRAAIRGDEYRDVRKPSIGFRVVAEAR